MTVPFSKEKKKFDSGSIFEVFVFQKSEKKKKTKKKKKKENWPRENILTKKEIIQIT